MTEWLKVLAWKAGVLSQKGTEGSNPSLSAKKQFLGLNRKINQII